MKKILLTMFLFLTLFVLNFISSNVQGEEYTTFEQITFLNDVKLMDSWTYEMTNSFNNELNKQKRKMFGWNKYYVYEKEPFEYVAETLYHVKNLGSKEITHTFSYSESYEETIQRNVTGSLKVDVSNGKDTKSDDKKSTSKFKYGLESELKFEYKQTEKTKKTEEDNIKIVIAPESELYIKVVGKGYLYSGVAKNYFFWVTTHSGGFEYVIITTEYYSIDMEGIEIE